MVNDLDIKPTYVILNRVRARLKTTDDEIDKAATEMEKVEHRNDVVERLEFVTDFASDVIEHYKEFLSNINSGKEIEKEIDDIDIAFDVKYREFGG